MKRLFLLRHARACPRLPSQSDFGRPLEETGIQEARGLARLMARRGQTVDAILSSSAERALATARLFAGASGGGRREITADRRLYMAGAGRLLQAVREMDDNCEAVLLVGHNPALSELLEGLCSPEAEMNDLPEGGLAELELDIDRWAEADFGLATLRRLEGPSSGAPEGAAPGESPGTGGGAEREREDAVSELWSGSR